jgi:hypothetical protein
MTRHFRKSRTALFVLAYVATTACSGATASAQRQAAASAPSTRLSLRELLAAGKLRVVNRTAAPLADSTRNGIRLDERPNDGTAWVTGVTLDEGTIDVDVRGRDVMQRSFVGLAFHGAADGSFESVYLRPFNYRATDPVRHKHAIQYVALPAYDFQRLRNERADQFENPVTPEPEATAWVHLRVVLLRDSVRAYVDGSAQPALNVPRLGTARGGEVGVWVGNVSDGEFANLRITPGR